MRVHLPKPLHGWREFAGEFGIIVLGVLVAPGFEQLVMALQERRASEEARKSIRAEITGNVRILRGRSEMRNCLDRKLKTRHKSG